MSNTGNTYTEEFRRDAVSRLVDAARKEDEAKEKAQAAAVALYQEALGAARDEDQVKHIVDRLRGYGEEVNLPEHFGFLMRWKLVGPFDNVEKVYVDAVSLHHSEQGISAGRSTPLSRNLETSYQDALIHVDRNNSA